MAQGDFEKVPSLEERIQMSYDLFKLGATVDSSFSEDHYINVCTTEPVQLARALTIVETWSPNAISKVVALYFK